MSVPSAAPGPRTRREERRAATRDAIVAGTLSLVAERGYAGASMHEVAGRAGVAIGSLYRHFPSKGDLLAEVFTDAAGHELALVRELAEDTSRPPRERLAAAVEAFARRALAAPTLAYALMAEPVEPAVEAARLATRRAYGELFANLLEDAMAAGEVRPLEPAVAAAAIVGALQEALVGPLNDEHGSDALVAALVTFVERAVAP